MRNGRRWNLAPELLRRKSGWVPFELTADEKQRAEEDWAMREDDGPDEDNRRDDE